MTTASTRSNLVANLAGRGIALVSTLAFLPAYLRLLGPDAYGLVGFFTALLGVLTLTDVGLSATLSRELARLSELRDVSRMRDTVRTLELAYAGIVIAVLMLLLLGAEYVGSEWVQRDPSKASDTVRAVRLMSVAAALQLGSSIYQGSLVGLQRHVRLNVVLSTSALLRGTLTTAVLAFRSPTADAFFLTHIAVAAATLLWIRRGTWAALGLAGHRPSFQRSVILSAWRYASGMMAMTLTGTVLMQSDKLVLSRLLPLDVFGYYTIAWTVAQLPLSLLSTPIQNTFFPRLTQLVARHDVAGLAALYHFSCQAMAAIVMPVAAVAAAFPEELLAIWIGAGEAARVSAEPLQILIVGSALAALTAIPYAAQLAHGWTRPQVILNTIAVAAFLPGLILLVAGMGMRGAGLAWTLLNVAYLCFIYFYVHRRILVGEGRRWLSYAVVLPIAVSFGCVFALRQVMTIPDDPVARIGWIAACWLATQTLVAASSPLLRHRLLGLSVAAR